MDYIEIDQIKRQLENEKVDGPCNHCYCRIPKLWSGTGPAPQKCCKCGDEKVITHGKAY